MGKGPSSILLQVVTALLGLEWGMFSHSNEDLHGEAKGSKEVNHRDDSPLLSSDIWKKQSRQRIKQDKGWEAEAATQQEARGRERSQRFQGLGLE